MPGRAALVLCLTACVPTLSAPRSETHLDRMAEASRHHVHGRDEAAAASFHEAAEAADRRVDRDEALYREAQSRRRAGELDAALTLFDEVAAFEPPSRRTARALFESARVRLERGERERALADLRAVCERFPAEGPASRALRLLALEAGGPEGRLALVRSFAAITEPDLRDDLHTLEAEALLERAGPGDRAAARAALERIVTERRYPLALRWDDTFMRLSELASEDGEPDAAIAYLERMLAPHSDGLVPGSYTQPRMPEAALRIARLERDDRHDREAADAAFQRVVREFGSSTLSDDARVERAEMWLDAGQRERGCALLREALDHVEVGAAARRAREHIASDCGG
jgi:tetratricopeptide (TPR) repeat protein